RPTARPGTGRDVRRGGRRAAGAVGSAWLGASGSSSTRAPGRWGRVFHRAGSWALGGERGLPVSNDTGDRWPSPARRRSPGGGVAISLSPAGLAGVARASVIRGLRGPRGIGREGIATLLSGDGQ